MPSFTVLDTREVNTAFFYELKKIYKKDPAFANVYENVIHSFLLEQADTDTTKTAFSGIISHLTTLTYSANEYRIIKFRAKTENRSATESPRLCAAIVYTKNIIVPLTVYTHGDTKKEPQITDLLKAMLTVLKAWSEIPDSERKL
jgi:hypothetical protein